MKSRVALLSVLFLSLFAFVSRAPAEKIFGTVWLEKYVPGEPATEEEDSWSATAKKARCYVCHVKGKSKKYCNTYGVALSQWLRSDNFERERVEVEEEQVKTEILAALAQAESIKDVCGTEFRQLFAAYELPSEELGAASATKEAGGGAGPAE